MRQHTAYLMSYLNGATRQIKAKLSCSSGTITDITSIDLDTDFGDTISIGCTVSASIKVNCRTPSFSISGTELTLSFGVPDGNDGWIWTQIGVFKVLPEELENRMGATSFTAYDRMYANTMKEYHSALTYPARLSAVLSEICSSCSLGTPPALTADPMIDDVLSEYTYRDALSYIASYQGKNACVNSAGNLEFRWFSPVSYTADDHKANIPHTDERNISIDKLLCSTGEETLEAGSGAEPIIFNNPLMTSERLTEMLPLFRDFTYRRLSADIPLGNYLIETGDIITVSSSGTSLTVPVMSLSFHYDGGLSCKLASFGVPDGVTKSISAKRFSDNTKFGRLQKEIEHATESITGANGGYIRINFGGDGKTAELMILDNEDETQAVNVWRFNQGGLGHSHNGYSGPFDDVALTADGHIVAERIAGAQIAGVQIRTTAADDHSQSYAQLEEGGMRFYTPEGNEVGSLIEIWEGAGVHSAGLAILTDPNRWFGIGNFVTSGFTLDFVYRQYGSDPFYFGKQVKIEAPLLIRKWGTSDQFDNVADELQSLRDRVAALEARLNGNNP